MAGLERPVRRDLALDPGLRAVLERVGNDVPSDVLDVERLALVRDGELEGHLAAVDRAGHDVSGYLEGTPLVITGHRMELVDRDVVGLALLEANETEVGER